MMNVRGSVGFSGIVLSALTLVGQCDATEWQGWFIRRVDSKDQKAQADLSAAVPTSGNPPPSIQKTETDPTFAQVYADVEAVDGDSYGYAEKESTAELNVAFNAQARVKLTQSTYASAESTHQGAEHEVTGGLVNSGINGYSRANGEFVVEFPPLNWIRCITWAQMRFKSTDVIEQGEGNFGSTIEIQVGDSVIAAYYGGGGFAPPGKWRLLGTLQTMGGPIQIDEVVDHPLNKSFLAVEEVFPEVPFSVEVGENNIDDAIRPGDDPGTSEFGATISGEVILNALYEYEP